MTQIVQTETLTGRKDELRELRAAIQKRESRLVWGSMDAGKTALVKAAISELSEAELRKCLYWTGPGSGRQLLTHLVGRLYELGDPIVRKKVNADGATMPSFDRWLRNQRSLRLRGILFMASTQGRYRIFLDHLTPPTHKMARLMKELMYQCQTPVYLIARGISQEETGYAWSLYWNDSLRVHLGPLHEKHARELLELCIRDFGLDSLDLEDFREDVLRMSERLPGSIVKICRLAADSKYHFGDRIKIKLVHLDYLMQSNPSAMVHSPNILP
jgi:hypothetical protein